MSATCPCRRRLNEARHVHVMRDYRVASGGRIHWRWPGMPLTLSGLCHHPLRWGPYCLYQSNLLRPIFLCLHNMRNNNIEVFIQSGRRTLPEYQVEVVDDKTVACYIPSEAGKVRPSARPRTHVVLTGRHARPSLYAGTAAHDPTTSM